jgi:hypothetical protein
MKSDEPMRLCWTLTTTNLCVCDETCCCCWIRHQKPQTNPNNDDWEKEREIDTAVFVTNLVFMTAASSWLREKGRFRWGMSWISWLRDRFWWGWVRFRWGWVQFWWGWGRMREGFACERETEFSSFTCEVSFRLSFCFCSCEKGNSHRWHVVICEIFITNFQFNYGIATVFNFHFMPYFPPM